MIRMIQSTSADHAKDYFTDALRADYYTNELNDQELQGQFLGRLADRIGMVGVATKEDFFALCENIYPRTGDPLTPIKRDNRTVGYDINFHCPKSVSVVHSLSKDRHIMDAFQRSVYRTMKDIEVDSMTRVRKKGAYEDRNTSELLWAEFIHQTARSADGSFSDPHLHIHAFCFNATWDDKEKQVKAGQFRDTKRDMPFYQARFHKYLSDSLIEQGYQIRRTDKSFEIVGVPQEVINLFSKRTNEIGEFAKKHGITDAKVLDGLGAKTRSKKQKGLTMSELKKDWRKQINEISDTFKDGYDPVIRYAPEKIVSKDISDDCVSHALLHSFERASVMPERRILATAYRQSIGNANTKVDSITESFKMTPGIIHVKEKHRTVCTTHEALAEEKRMVVLARQGQGKFQPLYKSVLYNSRLNEQQNKAIAHVMTTPHQVSIIRGAAGTGKTTILQDCKKLFDEADKQLFVVAPTAQASRGVLVEEGFKDATTVSKLLSDKQLQAELKDQVLWVDEAGLLGTADMTGLLELAKKQNARVILGGDTRQHSSVVRGDALRILNTIADIPAAEIYKILRQKNPQYKSAVEDLSKGNINSGFAKLDEMGIIKTIDPLNPNKELVADYIKTVKNGKSALIISPTHKQGNTVTTEIRSKLRSSGMLGKKEISINRLTNTNFTEAQKSDWHNFKKDQIITFNQNLPKIKRGSKFSVKEVTPNVVRIAGADDKEIVLPFDKASMFDVYNVSTIGLSKGDNIRITRNGFDQGDKSLRNGHSLEVLSVSKSSGIILENKVSRTKYSIQKDYGYIDYDYCTTSHSSQGKTVDEVFISQPSSTFTATDAKQFYVSVSRGRENVSIYTDDKEALLEYASEIGDRQSAIELISTERNHHDYIIQQERAKNDFQEQPAPLFDKTKVNENRDYEP